MKQRILLLTVMTLCITGLQAQQKEQSLSGYAITASEKGGRSWHEVRLVDIRTGAELKTIYSSASEAKPLNARTGKPVKVDETTPVSTRKVVNLDQVLGEVKEREAVQVHTMNGSVKVYQAGTDALGKTYYFHMQHEKMGRDKPFATNSAAMAYDKKHERLYYTPMGINQLRYIDLKSGTIYYFEDEPFGVVSGMGDAPNQITRMVIASDGNGYALTNDAQHLLRFTTGKKPAITDLGAVSEAAGAEISVHGRGGYGGDMIADASGNLYLITANRRVFKINIETRSASYLGVISGLPQGFSTNGAMVEEGSKVIIASSESTVGYYRFDLNTLQAEKVSGSGEVFNASDLANGILAFDKKKKEKKTEEAKEETKPIENNITAKNGPITELNDVKGITVFPNPVTNGIVKLSFDNQPGGRYQVQVYDMEGKLVTAREVIVQNRLQTAELKLPELTGKGTYFVRIFNEASRISSLTKLVVQ